MPLGYMLGIAMPTGALADPKHWVGTIGVHYLT